LGHRSAFHETAIAGSSALESLEAIDHRLEDGGIAFHLSEVKVTVMDRLRRSRLRGEVTGEVHLTQFDASSGINPDPARHALDAQPTQ
jgi:SulP family sulfate permease